MQVWPVLAGISVLAVIISAVYICYLPKSFLLVNADGLEVKIFVYVKKFVSGVLIILMFLLSFPNILLDEFSQISSTVEKSAKVLQVDKKLMGQAKILKAKIIENNGEYN